LNIRPVSFGTQWDTHKWRNYTEIQESMNPRASIHVRGPVKADGGSEAIRQSDAVTLSDCMYM